MSAFAVAGLWPVVALAAGVVWLSAGASAEEEHPTPGAMSSGHMSEQMQQARRELATGLAERAQHIGEDDWPSTTGSVSRRSAPAPVVEDLSGQGLGRLLFDMKPLGQPQALTPSEQKPDTGNDIALPVPPPVPVPAATLSPPDASAQRHAQPAPPRVRTGAVAQPREARRERAAKAPKAAAKAELRSQRRKKVQVAFHRDRKTRRSHTLISAPPAAIAGVVGAAGQGMGYVGRRIGFALNCLAHVRCRTTRQMAGTAVGAVAGGALGGAGGGVAGGVIGAVASAPYR